MSSSLASSKGWLLLNDNYSWWLLRRWYYYFTLVLPLAQAIPGLPPEILILHVCVIGPLLLLHLHDLFVREMGLYSCSVKRPAYI